MTRIPRSHPRYRSLRTRAQMAEAARTGLVVPEGLIAQGRAEAFDYFLGERTSPSARRSLRAAARALVIARSPVLSVNGNVAALAATEVARLAATLPTLGVEINLFHRTAHRVELVRRTLAQAGVHPIRGLRPTQRVPGLTSDRGKVDPRGIGRADVVIVPLEDGDRAEALRQWGKQVIAIDLNPLSRTSRAADIPIVDELRRALRQLTREVRRERARTTPRAHGPAFEAHRALASALSEMQTGLRRASRVPRRPPRARTRS